MAVGTYAELKTALGNWLAKTYDDERLVEFIALGEAVLNRRLRIREMETSADLSLTASTQTVALPTRYVAMRRLTLDGTPVRKLQFMPPIDFWTKWVSTTTSKPKAFTIEGENIVFGPIPDTTYTGKILYWASFAVLSDSNTTNGLLTKYPDAYLQAAMVEAMTFKAEEQGVIAWSARLERTIKAIELADQRDRFSGDVLVQRTDTGNPPQFNTLRGG